MFKRKTRKELEEILEFSVMETTAVIYQNYELRKRLKELGGDTEVSIEKYIKDPETAKAIEFTITHMSNLFASIEKLEAENG